MGKFALLIGVSDYEPGLPRLPAAIKDTVALQRVLEDPALGGFDEVTLLSNPNSGEMAQTIELWIVERKSNDLVLLFFSGHGLKDDRRELYFAATDTKKTRGQLVSSTAVSARTLHTFFRFSKPRQQIIILDCCFSGAFGRLLPRDDGELAFKEQLAAEGRVVLTSTNEIGYAFEEKGQEAELSIYTRYLIEGIEKAPIVPNSDGFTTVGGLHKFVTRKVRETALAMTPTIITLEGEGYDIRLARVPQESPESRYRKAVEARIGKSGEITSVGRRMLEDLRKQLKLDEKESVAIESEVLKPFREYQYKLNKYEEALIECVRKEHTLHQQHITDLKDYQKHLGLSDADVNPIEMRLMGEPLSLNIPSCVMVVPSPSKKPDNQLLLLDSEIARQWGHRPEDISVYHGKTLAGISIDEINRYRLEWKEIRCVLPSDLFLPELKFIDHMAEAIPGGLMPKSEYPLIFEGEHITPLIPINPLLLEYFTPEDLVSRLKFRPMSSSEPLVEVSLDISLTGMQGASNPENYRLTHVYSLKQENALACVPVLEIWPNFQSADWKAYYALFFDVSAADLTFYVNFPESVAVEASKDDQGGNYSLIRMEVFPSSIECLDRASQVIGLIFPKPPPEIVPDTTWIVGVDFGTSFTNIYVGPNGNLGPLTFDETLLAKITDSSLDTRFPCLFNYFIPDRFLPVEKPLPLHSVLTTRGSSQQVSKDSRAILDGRIYNPSVLDFDFREEWMETNLKWFNFSARRLFLQNLILLISVNALKQGAESIDWRISYPLAFSHSDRNLYASTWTELLQESALSTGISHCCSLDPADMHFRTENIAFAQYFADQEYVDFIHSTCIEIGGEGTSNISIWQDNSLLHQCSVDLAGRDFLSNFLELNPGFIARRFDQELNKWKGLRSGEFRAHLDLLLRWESSEWLRSRRPTLTEEPDMEGLIRLMALGVGGLYYYVGLLIKVLRDQDLYTRNFAPPIYIGGNGSRLLHWLDETGSFSRYSEVSDFLSRILSRSADIRDTEVATHLSSQPKDEVACGLVQQYTKLKLLQGLDLHSTNESIRHWFRQMG